MRDYEQIFGKTLDEDVKIGVIFALAPSQVQNHCHLNSHILKSYAQISTMLFDYCRSHADTGAGDVVPMDLSMLGKSNDKKGEGKGKSNAKTTKHFPRYCLVCKAWAHAMKDCCWNEGQEREGHRISESADHASCEHKDRIINQWDVDTVR